MDYTEERYPELENILNSIRDLSHITNRDYEIEFVNQACREIFGLISPGIKCYKYFHDLEDPCKWCRHEEVMMGKSYYTESYYDTTNKFFDVSLSPIRKQNGEIAKLVILRDITRHKRVEEELRQSEENYRSLVTNLEQRHLIYSHNTDGVFTYISPSITSILGYLPEEFMTHYETYLTVNPSNKLAKKFTELSLSGISQPPYELEIYHKNGRKIWLEVVENPVRDNKGIVTGIQGVAQDISDRKKAQETLLLNAQIEAMRKLIAGLSHEIRNPLFGISATSQILQMEITDEKYLPMIRALHTESNRITNLLNELNMYVTSKTPIISHIDIRSFVDRLQLEFSKKHSDVLFRVNTEPSLTIKGDEALLALVIRQLFENSYQADATEICVDVYPDIYLDGEKVNFSIRDNGKGMNEKDMQKCIEPFYTTKRGSTGLGLSLSKKIIEMHGGRFNIASRLGEGTSISISI